MNKVKGIIEKLKKPSTRVLILTYSLTVLFASLAFVLLMLDVMNTAFAPLAYVGFASAAVTLAYTVYTLVLIFPSVRNRVKEMLLKNEYAARFIENFGYRTFVSAAFATLMNFAYVIFNGIFGIIYSSIWYGALAAYYLFLSVTRSELLLSHRRRAEHDEVAARLTALRAHRNSGILLLIINIALSAAIAQMIFDDRAFSYPGWIIYAFAAYAFVKITFAIINTVRAARQKDYIIRATRNIALADAAVSIMALQTALLSQFSTDIAATDLFNTLTGCAVTIFTVSIAISMITVAAKELNKHHKEESNG